MEVRFLFLVVSIWFFFSPAMAVNVSFESLKGLVESRNGRVLGQKSKVEAAKVREGVFARSYLPQISLNGGYEAFKIGTTTPDQQPYYGLEGVVNVYNGGKDQLQENVQRLKTEIKENEVKITLAEELGRARELFWKIIYLKREKELLDRMRQVNEENLKAANKRISSGVATPSDRLEFEMKRLDLKREIKLTGAEEKSLSYDLLVYLGYEAHEPLSLTGDLEHLDEWEYDLKHTHEDHDFFTKPAVLLAQELQIQKQQKKRVWVPRVDLYAGLYQFNQREEDPASERERRESVVGVKLTMNLFDRFSARSEARALESEASAATALSAFRKKQNEAHIEKEFLELKTLHEQVHESEKHIVMAEKYYNATQVEYTRGAKNSPDVLSATERLEEVTRAKNKLVRDFQIARSHVLSKIGK